MNFDLKKLKSLLVTATICSLLYGCGEQTVTSTPSPIDLSREDTGYFCGMIVEDHSGPKSQIILTGKPEALWFTTTRDGIAFQRLPEETRPISAFYVSAVDLGGWDHPEADSGNMIEAHTAWFVINSSKLGSMGAQETIPFAGREAATAFAAESGGQVVSLAEIADAYVLGPANSR